MTSPHDPPMGARPGDVLAGKYRVERVLGQGGMGIVVAAHHVQLDTKVAIKFLLPDMLGNREAVARFTREARAAVKITSEHVARVLDVGVLDTGAPYMVMEFLEGGDLSAWLQQRGPLPIEQATEFVLQACVAVAEAHGLGIVHRDLKPANMFCVRRSDGQLLIKVLDFGISKIEVGRGSEPPGMSVTKTSAVMGSPLYMSPEQMQSAKSADAQSDIWALGVILYELLAGRVPFDGEAVTEVAVKVATLPTPSLRGARPDVHPRLEAVVFKCLEKDRQRRYRNVAELAVALVEFAPKRARALVERIAGTIQAAGLSSSALAMPPSPQQPSTMVSGGIGAGTSAPVSSTGSFVRTTRRPTSAALGIGLVGLLALGGAGVFVARSIAHRATGDGTSTASVPSVSPATWPLPSVSAASVTAPSASASASAAEVVSSPTPAVDEAGPPPRQTHSAPHPVVHGGAVQPSPPPPPQPQGQGASPNCDPPYTLDDQGRKHFKPECYLNK